MTLRVREEHENRAIDALPYSSGDFRRNPAQERSYYSNFTRGSASLQGYEPFPGHGQKAIVTSEILGVKRQRTECL